MNVVTHLLAGWLLADGAKTAGRDRALIAWSSVAPDADGLGMIVDATNRLLGRPETYFYEEYHHVLGHGLPAAVLWCAMMFAIGVRKAAVMLLIFLSFHLHLLMDIAGSRGSAPGDIWPIYYLAPISNAVSLSWSGQWPLTGWQSTTITATLMLLVMIQAVRHGSSPVAMFNNKADAVFVSTLRARFGKAIRKAR